jgi:osmoprotectant transport system substrate-binding protein
VAALACAALLGGAAGCGSAADEPQEEPADGIRVTSFEFVESRLLGELLAGALEGAGLPVTRRLALGPREVVAPALEQGLVDVVPEYAGSALTFLGGTPGTSSDQVRSDLEAALAPRGLRALAFASGQDQNGVVVSAATAQRLGLRRISELVPAASSLTFGGPPECPERPLCLAGLRTRYGLQFRGFVPFDSRAATAESLLAGQVDVGMLETVDAYLADGRLVLLQDDLGLQPPENVVPVVRTDVLAEYGPPLARTLDAVTETLTTTALVELDREVVLEGRPIEAVAQEWLQRHDLD